MDPKIVTVEKEFLPVIFVNAPEEDNTVHDHIPGRDLVCIYNDPKTIGLLVNLDDVQLSGIGIEEFSEWLLSPLASSIEELEKYTVPKAESITPDMYEKVRVWIGWEINTKLSKSSRLTLGFVTLKEIVDFVDEECPISELHLHKKYQEFMRKLYGRINIKRTGGKFFGTTNGFNYRVTNELREDLDCIFDPTIPKGNLAPTLVVTRIENADDDNEASEWSEVVQAKHLTAGIVIRSHFTVHAQYNPYYAGKEFTVAENHKMILELIASMDILRTINTDYFERSGKMNGEIKYIGTVRPLDSFYLDDGIVEREDKRIKKIHAFDVHGIRINIAETGV